MQTALKQPERLPMDRAAQPQIVSRRQDSVVFIELNRPERANAYTAAMLQTLEETIASCDADAGVRVIVISGAGDRSFSAGADRKELGRRDWHSVLNLASARVFRRIRQSRCVTIAAMNGAAVGGGLELALSCDLRFAVDTARFWLPEPELGLVPAAGGLDLLPQLVGPMRAKEMILGGAVWDAETAFRFGLLTEVTGTADLLDRIQPWVERIMRRDADALHFSKQAIDLTSNGKPGTAYDLLAQGLLVLRNRTQQQ